jgi:hypothetical protein
MWDRFGRRLPTRIVGHFSVCSFQALHLCEHLQHIIVWHGRKDDLTIWIFSRSMSFCHAACLVAAVRHHQTA